MADGKQVELLLRDVEAWNRWREEHRGTEIDLIVAELWNANLSGANLRGANLSYGELWNANLSGAKLGGAELWNANLSGAKLGGANLSDAKLGDAELGGADLSGANLSYADLSGANLYGAELWNANLSGADLEGADLSGAELWNANLRGAYLSGANLRDAYLRGANLGGANLGGANLSGANLSGADLSGANLILVQALRTNFAQAILTGACIEDWHTNNATKLDGVICDYIYLKDNIYLKNNQHERRPSDPNKNFAPGEFTKLFQKAISTVDLIFRNGINWEAFAHSFQQLQVKAGTKDLSIQAIENKGDGDFVIRVNTPPGADKAEIQRFVEQEYQVKLKVIEDKYRYQLQAKEESIAQYRQENTNLWSMAKLMASRPINNIAMAESNDNSNTFQNDFQGTKIANFANQVNDNARQQANQYNYASPEKQTLAEAAAEIQRLLQQLEETNPSANETEQIAYVNLATKPDLKQRAIAALKAGSDIAIDEFLLENKYLKVTKAIIQAWLQPNA